MTTEYDKLVRDRIPAITEENGETPETHVADDAEYERRLREKLVEEATEFRADGDIEELADVMAVVRAIREFRSVGRDELDELRAEKADERGGFADRVVLDAVEEP